MKRYKSKIGLLIVIICFILWPSLTEAEIGPSLDSELLIFEEIPVVVTATKY